MVLWPYGRVQAIRPRRACTYIMMDMLHAQLQVTPDGGPRRNVSRHLAGRASLKQRGKQSRRLGAGDGKPEQVQEGYRWVGGRLNKDWRASQRSGKLRWRASRVRGVSNVRDGRTARCHSNTARGSLARLLGDQRCLPGWPPVPPQAERALQATVSVIMI